MIASVSNVAFDDFRVERIDWPSPATPAWQVYGGGLTMDPAAGQASLGGNGAPAAGLAVRDGTWLGDLEAEARICSGAAGGIAFHVRDRTHYYLVGGQGTSAGVWKVVDGQRTALAGAFVPGLATWAFHQWYIKVAGTSIDVYVKVNGQGSWYHPVVATGNGANILTDLPAGLVGLAADGGGVGYATVCDYLRLGTDGNADQDLADAGEAWLSEDFGSAGLSVSLTYDNAGNLTDDGMYRYTYDAWNKLVQVQRHMGNGTAASSWPVIATYGYDGLGRRVQKVVKESARDLQRTEYHRYAGWQLLQIDDNQNRAQKQFVWGTRYIDEAIAMYNASYNGETVTWTRYEYLQDANYNVICLRNAGTGASERYEYDPYGVCRIYKGYDPSTGEESKTVLGESLFGNPIRYGGYFHDDETGLDYLRRRMYSARLQRLLQRDPWGVTVLSTRTSGVPAVPERVNPARQYSDGKNLYGYVKGNPILFRDPHGLRRAGDNPPLIFPWPGGWSLAKCEAYCDGLTIVTSTPPSSTAPQNCNAGNQVVTPASRTQCHANCQMYQNMEEGDTWPDDPNNIYYDPMPGPTTFIRIPPPTPTNRCPCPVPTLPSCGATGLDLLLFPLMVRWLRRRRYARTRS